MDYNSIVNLVVEILRMSLPIGIIFILTERIVQFFIKLAFPKILN